MLLQTELMVSEVKHTGTTPANQSQESPLFWVEQYGDYLFNFARQRVSSRELAEDLVQDTFLSAHKAYKSFEGRSSVKTWLVSILRNKIIDHLRRQNRVEFLSLDTTSSESNEHEPFNRFGIWKQIQENWNESPDQLLQSKEFLQQVYDCTIGMPETMKQVFLLRVVDQLKTKEICETLNVSEGNVATILHRARLRMRHCLHTNWFKKV